MDCIYSVGVSGLAYGDVALPLTPEAGAAISGFLTDPEADAPVWGTGFTGVEGRMGCPLPFRLYMPVDAFCAFAAWPCRLTA